ncbi:cation diffusion facilitator family transporter [Desulfonauticus submarinus]|uniref:Cation diffusion facilitator family transporter n=1 Tax=Desulfonauticus submarinus TaxID=206665 RepID=A0A1H0EST2_9BACT|nr:cation diffusion facilitator family transporter [Desulfonauticus submarinus]SDN85454.1 cation diffusion facilitator family transporter [Desulfonauticus submarinus]
MPKKIILYSIIASIFTIILKLIAAYLTNSVAIFSDALESFINLAASIVAYIALKITEKPADNTHSYGYSKVEYFASGLEGALILIASISIFGSVVHRIVHPSPLLQPNIGIVLIVISTLLNFVVALILLKGAKRFDSIVLEADAKHLLTDVATSLGVCIGVVIAFYYPKLKLLDPIIALIVAINILKSGYDLLKTSFFGLMDRALPLEEQQDILNEVIHYNPKFKVHNLRTRKSGAKRFIEFHLLLPGKKTVQEAHDICCTLENNIKKKFPLSEITIHIEPIEDKRSWDAKI